MYRNKFSVILTILLVITIQTFSQEIQRNTIDDKYKWNLGDMFKSVSEWQNEKSDLSNDIKNITQYKGKLGESADALYNGLQTYFDLVKRFYLVADYASRLSDEDLRNSKNQALLQEASNLGTQFSENTAFFSPEILTISPDKIKTFLSQKKELKEYQFFIEDIQRLREHTLNEEQEQILASAGMFSGTPGDVYNIFNNAEMPYSEVEIPDQGKVKLTPSTFTKYRTIDNRSKREEIFRSFFENYGKFKNTLGANYGGKVKADYFYAKNRKFDTSLEYALSGANIPVSVYENLITQINNNLPTLHRFLKLKKRMLGLDTLHYYDLYTPIVKAVSMKFSIEEGQKIISDALKPLGNDYLSVLNKAYNERWIDYYPTEGKRSGAYVSGAAYDVHPYMLLNWNDNFESLTTFAHELGHAMHSYYANKAQPFSTSNYATFVAEIASTMNENLLNDYMVQNAKSNDEKIYILGNYLELLRTTIFRQTEFAEFEWEVHKMAEKNEPITGEALSELYHKLTSKYYGNNAETCIVDPYIAHEWAYIPHFLGYNYYVFQYSTSLIYATAITEKVLKEGQPAVDKYLTMLKGGGSKYPIDLIKDAGVDPLSSEAFTLTMNRMNNVMDQIEELLAQK